MSPENLKLFKKSFFVTASLNGIKFAFIGSLIGMVWVVFSLYFRNVVRNPEDWLKYLDLLLYLLVAYPIALLMGGLPAFLTGFVLTRFLPFENQLSSYFLALSIGVIFGTSFLYLCFGFEWNIKILMVGVFPSAIASLFCTRCFLLNGKSRL